MPRLNDNFKNATEKSKYLFCDGSTFSSSKYPKLYKVLGSNKLPDLRERYLQGNTTGNTIIEAGLPNITGYFGTLESYTQSGSNGLSAYWGGAFYQIKDNIIYGYSETYSFDCDALGFDASRVSPVYGRSTTVTPPSVTVRYYIRAE